MITLDRLKEVLEYDPATGIFTWKSSNLVAGFVHSGGYLETSINETKYYLHRLAWFYMTGEWPPNQIDHINGVKDDNRWCNLRLATRNQNGYNAKIKSNSSNVSKNVYYEKRRNKYRVSVRANGKRNFVGYFKTEDEAINASDAFMMKHHKEYFNA